MISIEKLETTLKSLNMTVFIWKILSLVVDIFGIIGYYTNTAALKNGTYEKAGLSSQQIEQVRQAMTPWVLVSYLIAIVLNAVIIYLLFKNHKAIKDKDYIGYWPYYLSLGFLILPIITQIMTGFSWLAAAIYLVQAVIIVFTYLKAKQLNEVG
ncbi:hypothetical protein [Streptococcus tangpeifui]|uniref:hypothetical protein n=1 Tax=Streptococcus tangpeifui TaxID=2709400 RepID=UPI0013EADD44|nr:hypothetical protein [Streptococcus sp. ZJ373]